MHFIKKNFLLFSQCLLLLGLILSTGVYADHGHPNSHQRGQKIKKVININQNFRAGRGNHLNILQYLYNDYQLQSAVLKKVILKASTARGMGRAVLSLNSGQVGGPQVVATQVTRYVYNITQSHGKIPFSRIQNLNFSLRGNFYVDKIVLVFKKNDFAQSMPAKIMGKEIFKKTFYGERLKVRRLLGINGSYRGQKVKFVMLTTKGYGGGQAQLVINGQKVGHSQYVSGGQGALKLKVPAHIGGVLGQDIRALQVQVDGQMMVESLMVGLIEVPY